MLGQPAALSRRFLFDPAVSCTQFKAIMRNLNSDESLTVKLTPLSISMSYPII
jgi:hypothetical protein